MQNIRLLLLPFSMLYWLAIKVRNFLFDLNILKGFSPDLPTICIGNLTVGGTGKTPHSEYLIQLLQEQYQVGILSRGYKRLSKGFKLAEENSSVEEIGDEPLQIKHKYPKTIVAVDEDRVNGYTELLYLCPDMDVLLLDDAFQHRYIKPGLSILLTDYNNLITRDYPLPVGNLRDSISEKRRANIIVVTKCPINITEEDKKTITQELKVSKNQTIYFSGIQYGELKPVFSEQGKTIEINNKLNIYALAGIANPYPFFDYLVQNFQIVGKKSYTDHHRFSEKEIRIIFEKISENSNNQLLVVTTEKDAARIRCLNLEQEMKDKLYYLSININFLGDDAVKFNNQILNYVRKN